MKALLIISALFFSLSSMAQNAEPSPNVESHPADSTKQDASSKHSKKKHSKKAKSSDASGSSAGVRAETATAILKVTNSL